jgi:hypothetical protein
MEAEEESSKKSIATFRLAAIFSEHRNMTTAQIITHV